MAVTAFPEIAPSARTWTPGSQPLQTVTTLSGYESRVLLGPDPVGTTLVVSFQNLQEVLLLQITDHYALARGSFETFQLPAAIFAGMNDYSSVTPVNRSWRYASAPTIDWVAPGIGNASVSFVAVPV